MDQMIKKLTDFETQIYLQWTTSVGKQILNNMKMNVLVRQPDNLLMLNFSDELNTTLSEVRYLKAMEVDNIPKDTIDLYDLVDPLWDARMLLYRIVEWYNDVRANTEECEFALIEAEIKTIDSKLSNALSSEKWSKYDQAYIQEVYDKIQNLYDRIQQAHDNINLIIKSFKTWGTKPLYQRTEVSADRLLNFDERHNLVPRRVDACYQTKNLIAQMIEDNFRLFSNIPMKKDENVAVAPMRFSKEEATTTAKTKESSLAATTETTDSDTTAAVSPPNSPTADEDETTDEASVEIPYVESVEDLFVRSPLQIKLFENYEKYVDGIVSKEILAAINLSIKYIKFEMEDRFERKIPLFEVKLRLIEPDIVFVPSLDLDSRDGLMTMIERIFMDIYIVADLIPRVVQIPESERLDENGEAQEATYSSKYFHSLHP